MEQRSRRWVASKVLVTALDEKAAADAPEVSWPLKVTGKK